MKDRPAQKVRSRLVPRHQQKNAHHDDIAIWNYILSRLRTGKSGDQIYLWADPALLEKTQYDSLGTQGLRCNSVEKFDVSPVDRCGELPEQLGSITDCGVVLFRDTEEIEDYQGRKRIGEICDEIRRPFGNQHIYQPVDTVFQRLFDDPRYKGHKASHDSSPVERMHRSIRRLKVAMKKSLADLETG
jgi:hypothetical protein